MTKIIFNGIFVWWCLTAIPTRAKVVRKPHNVKIELDALHRTRGEALRSKKTLTEWLEEAIDEKIESEQKRVN